MPELLSRCGYRCDLCLAFRPNVEANPENRQVLSDGWHRYFGFRIPPEDIVCDGCRSEGGRLIDGACPVRPCVIERSLTDCSACAGFGCAKLVERLVVYEEIAARRPEPIPDADRVRFILPYENKRRLEDLRHGSS
jgi:hypothetical protein